MRSVRLQAVCVVACLCCALWCGVAWGQKYKKYKVNMQPPQTRERMQLLPLGSTFFSDATACLLPPEADVLWPQNVEPPARLSLSMRFVDATDPLTGDPLAPTHLGAATRDFSRFCLQGVVDKVGAEVGLRLRLLDF